MAIEEEVCTRMQEELLKKIQEDNVRLKQENSYLKSILSSNNIQWEIQSNVQEKSEQTQTSLTKREIEIEKERQINVFRSLFKGREDVYARGYISKKSSKMAYSPVCQNFWKENLCLIKNSKRTGGSGNCNECSNRVWAHLDNDIIWRHLLGKDDAFKDVVGVYPMLLDETCHFIVFDFDDGNWQEDVKDIRIICKANQIEPYVERSRSGSGAHIWFFFEEAVPALIARRFGSCLMSSGADLVNQPDFKSYDRMLPNQDYMPKGGLGNLIALPYQGQAKRNGNSVFVDEDFIPIASEMEFLSGIERLCRAFIDRKIKEWESTCGELGSLVKIAEEISKKPWEKAIAIVFKSTDMPKTMTIVKANMLYVPKEGCTPKFLNQIRRIAAFHNPEYYKKRAMRLPLKDIPRIIQCHREEERYVAIPRGCEEQLHRLLDMTECRYNFSDERQNGREINITFNGILYEKQQHAADCLLENETGIISAAPGFGKTVIGCYLMASHKVNTLILVQNSELMKQWSDKIEEFLTIDEEVPIEYTKKGRIRNNIKIIGTIGGQKNNIHGIIDIAMMQSLVKEDKVNDIVKDYGMIIVDECHHVGAYSFEQVLDEVNARYVYGLSATPYREDGHQPIIFMQCGKVRYGLTTKERLEELELESWIVPRFTPFVSPISIQSLGISDIYKSLLDDDVRNSLIVEDVCEAVKIGRTPLVLTKFVEHADNLVKELKKRSQNVYLLRGGISAKEKNRVTQILKNIPYDKSFVVVAIGKYIGEGFDLPRLDTLFLTMPISWKGNIEQYAGRLHRSYEGKKDVVIYDYVDFHVSMLENMFHKRMAHYTKIGYEVRNGIQSKMQDEADSFYTNENYREVFESDLHTADKEIVIASPYMVMASVKMILKILSEVTVKGVKSAIVTKTIDTIFEKKQAPIKEMHTVIISGGVKLLQKDKFHQKFAVIDRKIVWFGGINLLAYGKEEDCMMRIDNTKIAQELLGEIQR